MTAPAFLLVAECAAELRVDPVTIRRAITAGRLVAIKDGATLRIPADEWRLYLERCRTDARRHLRRAS